MRHITAIIMCMAILLASTASRASELRGVDSVTVLAASSLTNVLSEISSIYTRETGIAVSIAYDSSYAMANQIIDGESADVFISASPNYMADLKQRGLIDVFSLTNLLSNSLVLTASKQIHLPEKYKKNSDVKAIITYLSNRAIPVIADPAEVPLGFYSKQVLYNLDLWEELNHRLIRTENARASLYLIAKGETLGITYLTDAINNPEVNILAPIPDNLHESIIYQAAVVAGENMKLARDFLKFLTSNKAKKIFEKHHFGVE